MNALKYFAPKHVAIALLFQVPMLLGHAPFAWLWTPAIVYAFFLGREINEAEDRWMQLHNTNRAGMPWWARFTWDAWRTSPKSFTDFIVPTATSALLSIAYLHFGATP